MRGDVRSMKWRKLDNWFPEIPEHTHAALPTYFEGEVYFSPRTAYRGFSVIYKAELNLKTLTLGKPRPVLREGKPGAFDDSGAMVSCIVPTAEGLSMYYIGWNQGIRVPFRNSIGLAYYRSGHWIKAPGPVLDRSVYDPYFVASCWVLPGKPMQMWYLSCDVRGWAPVAHDSAGLARIRQGHESRESMSISS